MRILTRYVLSEFSKVFGLCLAAFLGIYYVIDAFNHIEIFINYKAPLALKFSYFLFKLPLVIYQVAPVAMLIAVVTVIGLMARNGEITALKAGGVSMYTFTAPLLVSAAVVSGLIWVNNEHLLPSTNERAATIYDVGIRGKPPRGIFRQSRIWYVGKDNSLWNIQTLDPTRGTLEGITLLRFDEGFHLVERVDAREAAPVPGGWEFRDAVRRTFTDDGTRLREARREARLVLPAAEKAADFQKYKKDPDEMNFRELRSYVERLRQSGFNAVPYETDLLAKTSVPLISLFIAFLSVGLALRGGGRGGVVASVGLCLAVGLAYWLVLALGLSLGHAGRVHPIMAAWGANIIFGSAGLLLYTGLRQ